MTTNKKTKTTSSTKRSTRPLRKGSSSKAATSSASAALPESAVSRVVLSEDVVRRLAEQVHFPTQADLLSFVSDAINSYVQLGHLSAQGKQFFMSDEQKGAQTRMRFPFESSAD